MSYILKTVDLTKTYNGKDAVSNVSMHIKKGEIYGFLGPNGAGKTTVMRMATNLVKPTSGEVEVFGEKLTNKSYEILKRIGAVIEYPIFYESLTAKESLELHLGYMGCHDKKAIDQALELVGLTDTGKKPVRNFSLGMKQRLGIARAITTKPEFLMLDEPINGLDPIGINEFRNLFKMLSKEYGITLFISSHILGEVERIADTIGVINKGKLIKEVSMDTVLESTREYLELKTGDCKKAAYVLDSRLGISNFKVLDDAFIRIYDPKVPQSEISKTLIMNDVSIEALNNKPGSLEDYFLNLLNGGAGNA